jgi:molecular chaperone DnaJ
MTAADAYRVLGLPVGAPWEDVRAAHRRLAKELHPDLSGGDTARMAAVNDAFAALASRSAMVTEDAPASTTVGGAGTADDPVTFAIDVLPVEAFDALLLVTASLGDPWVIDEPYELTALLDTPLRCRCHLTLVPEAGGTIVTVEVEPIRREPSPSPVTVAEALIAELQALGT